MEDCFGSNYLESTCRSQRSLLSVNSIRFLQEDLLSIFGDVIGLILLLQLVLGIGLEL